MNAPKQTPETAPKAVDDEAVATAVREICRTGRGADASQVCQALAEAGYAASLPDETAAVAAILAGHPGLASFTGLDGQSVYHDPAVLSATYARIVERRARPATLIAAEVRRNSRDYPRPLPIGLFACEPFGLSQAQIAEALSEMEADERFADIAFVATGDGAVYLYSSLHLEPAHAAFLAEHAQNMAANP